MDDKLFTQNDLIDNPTPRCACMLVLDTSSSMSGEPISSLNEGVQQFVQEVQEDEFARYSVELGIITFGGSVQEVVPLQTLENFQAPELSASGYTPMGEAVNLALDRLEQRKQEYKSSGVSYYQPWMVLMTDGQPNDEGWERAAQRLRALGEDKKIAVFGIGIGEHCDMQSLALFCPSKRPPLPLAGLKFREFFVWLSQSMSRVSQSTPGSKVPLADISGWVELESNI
ncbi:MAG: VWA domain-containing protein [Calditrichia bacterium]